MGESNIENCTKARLFLLSNRGYLKKSKLLVSKRLGITVREAEIALQSAKQIVKKATKKETVVVEATPKLFNISNRSVKDILIIGDLHAPFILDNYLEWCYGLQKEYKTTKTIFIGDIIDGHSWSYHESDVDGMSVGHELEAAIKQLSLAYKLFPEADITLGNHDLLIARKARSAGLSRHFIKDFRDVIQAPKSWNFSHQFAYDNVNYIHGSIGNAFTRAKDSRTSTVQGHLHSQAFLQYSVSEKDVVFGLQIGAGIDYKSYAFEYAKPMTKKPIISAGVILDNGRLPILRLMPL